MRKAGSGALLFIFILVLVDSVGFGILLPVLPRLIMQLTGVGMCAAFLAYLGYALATQGWMMYVVGLTTFLFALTYPSMNALASQQIAANAQGELQGAVASLYSLSAIIGPPLMTQILSRFSDPRAVRYFPGAAFLTAAALTVACAVLFLQALRRTPRSAAHNPAVASEV